MRKLLLIMVLLMLSALIADAVEQRRVLLPVYVNWDETVPGARGTQWTTELWVRNQSDDELVLVHSIMCIFGPCGYEIPPLTTERPYLGLQYGFVGAMLRFPEEMADSVHMSLGIRELSSGEFFSGYLPVVYDEDLFEKPVEFVRVALEPDRRYTLRVYDPSALRNGEVLLQVWDGEDQLLVEQKLLLWLMYVDKEEDWAPFPQVAVVNDLKALLPEDIDFVRVRLTPLSPELKYWAFISATHNVTQDLNVILPD